MRKTKMKLSKVLLAAGIAIATAMVFFISAVGNQDEKESAQLTAGSKMEVERDVEILKQELMEINGYLTQMDETMSANKESLQSMAGENETYFSQYEVLDQKLNSLGDSLSNFRISYEGDDGEIRQQITDLEQVVVNAQKELHDSHAETQRLLNEMEIIQADGQEVLGTILTDLKADIVGARKKLEGSGKDIMDFLQEMDEQNKVDREDDILFIDQILQEIAMLITEDMGQLLSALEADSSEIQLLIENKTLDLSGQVSELQDQIYSVQEEINLLLDDMATDSAARQEEIRESFGILQEALVNIQDNYTQMHEEVKSLFQETRELSSENHLELVSVLGQMDAQMSENSQVSLSLMTESMEQLQQSSEEAFASLSEEMSDAFQGIDSELNSQFDNFDEKFSSQFSDLNVTVDSQIGELTSVMENKFLDMTNIVNSGDEGLRSFISDSLTETNNNMTNAMNDINRQMESVFQSVNSGKRLLASALFTKGINTREDATFQEIYEAILNIPQDLFIGVQEVPGTITYDYHYHVDADGNNTHSDSSDSSGGCFTVPVYHLHSGSSLTEGGCYTQAIYHTHSSSCYTTSRCNRHSDKVVGGKWVDHYMHGRVYVYELQCPAGHTFSSWGESSGNCDVSVTSLTCTKEGQIIGYGLGCGKDENTIECYSAGCGLSDGQIIGAHIVYN